MNHPDSSIAYVELYVADAVPALENFTRDFAFTARALAEHPDRYSVLLTNGSARLIVTEPRGDGPVAQWLALHGDGVRDIALYQPEMHREHTASSSTGPAQLTQLQTPTTDLPPGFNWQTLVSRDRD